MATVLTYLGRTEEAVDDYEKAFEERSPAMVCMSLIPVLDAPIADDPRTQSLIRSMGFQSSPR